MRYSTFMKVNKADFDVALGKLLRAPAVPLATISPKKNGTKRKAKKRTIRGRSYQAESWALS